jgi:hypothetical protein
MGENTFVPNKYFCIYNICWINKFECKHFYFVFWFYSPCCNAVSKYLWMLGLVLCWLCKSSGFWTEYPVVLAVYSLFVCLLVQATLRSFQVKRVLHNILFKTCEINTCSICERENRHIFIKFLLLHIHLLRILNSLPVYSLDYKIHKIPFFHLKKTSNMKINKGKTKF